jgi:hypothetical protein
MTHSTPEGGVDVGTIRQIAQILYGSPTGMHTDSFDCSPQTPYEIHGAQELRTKYIAVKPTHSLVRTNICVDPPCNRIVSLNHYSGCCESFVVVESVRGQEVSAERLARRFISFVKLGFSVISPRKIQAKVTNTQRRPFHMYPKGWHIPEVKATYLLYRVTSINRVSDSN